MDINGPWEVWASINEGSSSRFYGAFSGPLDRVALANAHHADYQLDIKPLTITPTAGLLVSAQEVYLAHDVFGGESQLRQLLEGRPVRVVPSNFYHTSKIVATGEEYRAERAEVLVNEAKKKLTTQEFDALRASILMSNLPYEINTEVIPEMGETEHV